MPEEWPVFKPTDYDLRKSLDQPFIRYLLVKAGQMSGAELMVVRQMLRSAYWARLRELPVIRLWPDQWLAEEWRRYARL